MLTSRIQGYPKQEGVVSAPIKMEHVRERVRASQGFKDIQNRRGVVSVPIKVEHVRERVHASQGFKDIQNRRG